MITKIIASVDSPEEREKTIKDILSRGKVVVFKNKRNGIEKHVDAWKPDEMGDLKAFHSTGQSKYVCWEAKEYDILEKD